jgi:ATP-dependent DNA helicase RecQ
MPDNEQLLRTAEEIFGWTELRPEQLLGMRHLVDGQDVLVVMPTGAGKSAIYQVPAILLDGPTVVVSPLVALQRDQVTALRASDAPHAAAVNSAQPAEANEQTWQAFTESRTEYLFLSPEQLANAGTLQRLHQAKPSLSSWTKPSQPSPRRPSDKRDEISHG